MRSSAGSRGLARVMLLVVMQGIVACQAQAQDAGVGEGASEGETESAGEGEGEGEGESESESESESAGESESETEGDELHGSDVGAAVGRTRVAIQAVRSALRPRRGVEGIYRDLPHLSEDVERLEASRSRDQIARMSQRELADARHQWHEYEDQFEEWRTTLSEREDALDEIHDELRELRAIWASIAERAPAAELPDAMRERIPSSMDAIEYYDTQLDGEIERTRNLEDRVAELTLGVMDVTEQIEQATRGFRDRLFVRDSLPIWQGISREAESTSLTDQARASWVDRVATASVLIGRSQAPAAIGLLLMYVVLASWLSTLARRSHTWAEDDTVFAHARAIVRKPFSTAALLMLSIAPFVVLNAPMLFYDLVLVLLLVPLLRVLPPLLPKHVKTLLYIVAVFLIVVRIESMTIEGSGLRRVVLTVECIPAIALLGRWLWVERGPRTPLASGPDTPLASGPDTPLASGARTPLASGPESPTWLRAIVLLAFIIATSAFLADLFGWVFLSAMLMRGIVASAYAAFALFAGIVVLETLLAGALKSATGAKLRAVREHGDLVRRRSFSLLAFIAAVMWAEATLEGFGMTRPFLDWAEELLGRSWDVGSASFSIGSVILFFVILFVAWGFSRFVRFVLELDVLPRLKLEPGVDGAISTLTRYVILSLGFLLGLASVGVDESQIALVAGALGVGVGFGLQSIVSNIISGIILMLERPVRLGDFIEVGPLVGRVERIGLRSSTVRALDGAEVIVPNDSLISREVVNWTLSDRRRRVRVKVGVAYGTDLEKAREVMKGVALAHAQAIGGPSPEVLFDSFGESSLDFVLEFWTTDFAEWEHLRSAVGLDLYEALTKAGIEIPFPQRDVHVKTLPAKSEAAKG